MDNDAADAEEQQRQKNEQQAQQHIVQQQDAGTMWKEHAQKPVEVFRWSMASFGREIIIKHVQNKKSSMVTWSNLQTMPMVVLQQAATGAVDVYNWIPQGPVLACLKFKVFLNQLVCQESLAQLTCVRSAVNCLGVCDESCRALSVSEPNFAHITVGCVVSSNMFRAPFRLHGVGNVLAGGLHDDDCDDDSDDDCYSCYEPPGIPTQTPIGTGDVGPKPPRRLYIRHGTTGYDEALYRLEELSSGTMSFIERETPWISIPNVCWRTVEWVHELNADPSDSDDEPQAKRQKKEEEEIEEL